MKKCGQKVGQTDQGASPRVLGTFYLSSLLGLIASSACTNYGLVVLSQSVSESNGFAGLVLLTNYLPSVLLLFWAGRTLDRYSKRNAVLGSQLVYIVAIVLAAWLTSQDELQFSPFWLLVVGGMNGLALAVTIPGRLALIGEIAPPGSVATATIALNVVVILGFILGPIVFGAVLGIARYSTAFLTALGLLVTSNLLLLLVPRDHQAPSFSTAGKSKSRNAALAFLRSKPVIPELLAVGVLALFLLGPILILMPCFSQEILGLDEAARGRFMATFGIGLLIGGGVAAPLQARFRPGPMILTAAASAAAFSGLLSGVSDLWTASTLMFLIGLFGGLNASLIPACIQAETPNALRGKVMAYYSLLYQATPASAGVMTGLLFDVAGFETTMRLTGVVMFTLAVFCTFRLRALRTYSGPQPQPDTAQAPLPSGACAAVSRQNAQR